MKLFRFRAPSSQNAPAKNRRRKKYFSIVLASIAMTNVALNTARDLPYATADEVQSGVVSIPLGLTRKRPAFRKAIEILTDGAGANKHLANYLDRLTKRIKGDEPAGENNSGIVAVKQKTQPAVPASETSPVMSMVAANIGARHFAETAAPVAKSTPASDTQSSDNEREAAAQFTVGDMSFDTNPAIEHWMSYYTSSPIGRRTMKIGFERSSAYLEMARAEFRKAGVPEDLVWLAFVESVWNPRAVSPAAAGGIWQFIPATATDYGLRVQSGNDERADPFKQTRVAATYLHDLYTIFGDWALAMAAYNSGEPRVMGAIVRNGRADFWDLYEKELLPKETRDYVPKILAAIKVASQPDNYGLAPQAILDAASGS